MQEVDIVKEVDIEHVMKEAYLEYALSVNMGRAIPDLRDGLKPVQRRVVLGLLNLQGANRNKFIKSARVVGEVMGKYHPHGDTSIYIAAISMSTDWGNRVPLIIPQGNNGSIGGDNPAAMRYTEMRLAKYIDFSKDDLANASLPIASTYDDSGKEYILLDLGFPNILINGTRGIGVSISSYIPSFNPKEILRALQYIVNRQKNDKKPTVKGIARYIKGPDFPTGGNVYSDNWLRVLETGKGNITHEAELYIDARVIHVKSIPVETTIEQVINSITKRAKELTIKNIEDFSSSEGVDIKLTYKKDVTKQDINMLYKHTKCSEGKKVNMVVCSSDGVGVKPVLTILEEWLEFVYFNKVATLITMLKALREELKMHEYKLFIFKHLNVIIKLIRSSDTDTEAIDKLMEEFDIDDYQAKYITTVKLSTITKDNMKAIMLKYKEIKNKTIKKVEKRISNPIKLKEDILENMGYILTNEMRRKTKILEYINRDVYSNTNIGVYISDNYISAKVYEDNEEVSEGTIKLKGSDSIYIVTSDGVGYRISTPRISERLRSAMTYITPRSNKVEIVYIGVYIPNKKIMLRYKKKKERVPIPEDLNPGTGGRLSYPKLFEKKAR